MKKLITALLTLSLVLLVGCGSDNGGDGGDGGDSGDGGDKNGEAEGVD